MRSYSGFFISVPCSALSQLVYIDENGFVPKRSNSSALAMELRLLCTNPWIYAMIVATCRCVGALFVINYIPLTHLVLMYFDQTRSVSWLLVPWILPSLGHQQSQYWLCSIYRALPSMRRNSAVCFISVSRNDEKYKCVSLFFFLQFSI